MASLLPTPYPPDPVEGQLGHFEHSNWVKASLLSLDAGTVHSEGGTVTGVLNAEQLTVNDPATEDAFVSLVGNRNLGIQGKSAAGVMRWRLDLGDGTTEGGGNSGTIFQLLAYSDAGAQLHQVLKAARSDGLLEVKGSPTAAKGIATKEYVDASMPIGAIIAYGGSAAPAGWHLCNGTAHGSSALQTILGSANTPDLSGRFIVGSGTGYNPGSTGGTASNTLTQAQTPTKGHTHAASAIAETTEHQHLVDPPATATNTIDTNHLHSGSTGSMNRNASHSHSASVNEGITTGDSDRYLDTADNDASVGEVFGPVTIYATDTNHEHGFTTGWMDRNNAHAHSVDIGAFWSGGRSATHTHGVSVTPTVDAAPTASIENRPPYYALVYIIKKA